VRWVRNNLDPSTGNVIIVSELLKPEIEGTLSRYHLGKYILTRAHVMLRNEFLRHFEKEYLVVTVGASLLDYATQLIRKLFGSTVAVVQTN
jgi:hypothetical protein